MDDQAHRPEGEPARASDPPAGPVPPPVPPPAAQVPPGPVPPPPTEAWAQPVRIEPVPGTPYGLAILGAPSATSGPAVGSLVTGIASILIALVVTCFGLAGAADGWGIWVAGAFALLAGALGTAGVGLGIAGLRQTRQRPGAHPPGGRGLAIAGLICGGTALVITGCTLATVGAIQLV